MKAVQCVTYSGARNVFFFASVFVIFFFALMISCKRGSCEEGVLLVLSVMYKEQHTQKTGNKSWSVVDQRIHKEEGGSETFYIFSCHNVECDTVHAVILY